MNKSDAKKIAKDIMLTAIGTAYYRVADSTDYTLEEQDLIIKEIDRYGERMAKAINGTYTAY